MNIYLGSDHRGFKLKEKIKEWLIKENYQVQDLGNNTYDENDDYVDFAKTVADQITKNSADRGIVFCGSGVGVDITVNRYPEVRSGFILNKDQIEIATRDDHINILSVAADFINEEELKKIISVWLKTNFSQEERHLRRLQKMKNIK